MTVSSSTPSRRRNLRYAVQQRKNTCWPLSTKMSPPSNARGERMRCATESGAGLEQRHCPTGIGGRYGRAQTGHAAADNDERGLSSRLRHRRLFVMLRAARYAFSQAGKEIRSCSTACGSRAIRFSSRW